MIKNLFFSQKSCFLKKFSKKQKKQNAGWMATYLIFFLESSSSTTLETSLLESEFLRSRSESSF